MLALQLLGFPFGFSPVKPQGEFKNWLLLLEHKDGGLFDVAKIFWGWDHRNPLSPWWYMAAKSLILSVPAAPAILHMLAGLFVGITAYLLFTELTRSQPFAFSVGLLCALYVGDVRLDDVMWVFVIALGFTFLTMQLFARFCKGGRKNYHLLAGSLLAWFVALGTYTIQMGAIAGVFFIAYRARRSLLGALSDTAPYAAFLILFIIIWITTASPGVSAMFELKFSFDAMLKSIAAGLWPSSYEIYWIWIKIAGPWLMATIFVVLAPLIFLVVRGVGGVKPSRSEMGFSALIGACVVAPTVALESSSQTWFPGTRWLWLLGFWTPLLFCLLAFAAIRLIVPKQMREGTQAVWPAIISGAAAFTILTVLACNNRLIIASSSQ